MTNPKNAAAEWIEQFSLPHGWSFQYIRGQWQLVKPDGHAAWRGENYAEFAAAMSTPPVSATAEESDDDLARKLHKAGLLHGYDPDEAMDRAADIIAKHRQPVAPSRTAEEVLSEVMRDSMTPFMDNIRGLSIIQSALDAHGIGCARLALEAAGNEAYSNAQILASIRAIDPAAIVKGK